MCEVVGFYLLFVPSVRSDVARACAMGAYGALACVAFVSFFIACGVDPAARKISEDEVEHGDALYCRFSRTPPSSATPSTVERAISAWEGSIITVNG